VALTAGYPRCISLSIDVVASFISTRGNTVSGKRGSRGDFYKYKSRCSPANEALPLCRTGNYSGNVIAYRYLYAVSASAQKSPLSLPLQFGANLETSVIPQSRNSDWTRLDGGQAELPLSIFALFLP